MGVERTVHISVSDSDWQEFKHLTAELRIKPTTVINLMIRQANLQGGIPFDISLGGRKRDQKPLEEQAEPVAELVAEPVADTVPWSGEEETPEEDSMVSEAITSEALFA